jgi:DNA helicase HerA-like ATPase
LKRHWSSKDRRRAAERHALDLTVQATMAWKDRAVARLSGGNAEDAEERLRKLDLEWQVDPRLIPDRQAVTELLRLCREIEIAPQLYRDEAGIAARNTLTALADRVLESAVKRSRELS